MTDDRWFARDTMDGEQYEVVGVLAARLDRPYAYCWRPKTGHTIFVHIIELRGKGRELAEALLAEVSR